MDTQNTQVNNQPVKSPTSQRKVYEKPKLEILGDVRTLTLGGSVGAGESGGMWNMNGGRSAGIRP